MNLFRQPTGFRAFVIIWLGQLISILVGIAGYFIPLIRNAEDLLPDHETLAAADN